MNFFQALKSEQPLQIAGVINAYSALLARQAGFKALYLSGAGVANACFGIPDIGLTHFEDVFIEAKRIMNSCDLPLLVDIDTGFENELSANQLMTALASINVAAIQIEDQVIDKRCGHLAGKTIVTTEEMKQRLAPYINAKINTNLVIMARTDAYSIDGLDATISRVIDYQSIGADMIFVESLTSLEEYRRITNALDVPVLANITEFGQTPLFTIEQLAKVNIAMVLYPLTAFRVMSKSALDTYKVLKQYGTQQSLIDNMQTREQLYDILDYQPNKDDPIK